MEEQRRAERRQCGLRRPVPLQMASDTQIPISRPNMISVPSDSACCGRTVAGAHCQSDRGLESTEEDDDPSLCSIAEDHNVVPGGNSSCSSSESTDSNTAVFGGCCDFNFKAHDVDYDSMRADRYNSWCNERYFKSLRPPLAILHEIVSSYPQRNIGTMPDVQKRLSHST